MAALAATGVYAQSSVTVFGVADVGYRTAEWTNNGALRAKANGVADGAMAGNRFGFRGTEDLGGGLRAGFVIEQGISLVAPDLTNQRQGTSSLPVNGFDGANGASTLVRADSGRTTAVNRQSFLSLGSSSLGEIRIGFQYNNLYEVSTLSGFNIGSEGTHGADTAHTVFGGAAWGGTRANGLTYISPKLANAVTLRIQRGAGTDQEEYVTNSTANAGYKQERMSFAAEYAAGPLKAMIAQTSYKSGASTAGSTTMGTTTTADLTQIGASYNLGFATIAGTYATGDDGAAGAAKVDTKAQQIGISIPMGAWTLRATTGSGTQKTSAATNADVKQNQLGVNYSLSKRTTAYVYTGTTKDTGAAATAVDKKTATIFGVLHTF